MPTRWSHSWARGVRRLCLACDWYCGLGRRAAPHQPSAPAGLGRPRGARRTDPPPARDQACAPAGHARHGAPIAPPPGHPEMNLPAPDRPALAGSWNFRICLIWRAGPARCDHLPAAGVPDRQGAPASDRRLPSADRHSGLVRGRPRVPSIDSITLSNGEGQRERSPSRLIETGGGRWGFALAFERSRRAGSRTACRPQFPCGLALERGAGPSGLAVVWLERGANARRSGIRHARHGSFPWHD